jgi:hypothetical protein
MTTALIIIAALCIPIIAAYLVYKAGPSIYLSLSDCDGMCNHCTGKLKEYCKDNRHAVSNLNTSEFKVGDKLYLDPDRPGCLTNEKPLK